MIVLETDVAWIDTCDNAPREGARVFVVDPDPLKQTYGWSHVDAEMICRADSEVALEQLVEAIDRIDSNRIDASKIRQRGAELAARHDDLIARLRAAETSLKDPAVAEPAFILGLLREAAVAKTPSHGQRVLWLNEGISNYPAAFDHIRPTIPGSMIASGGSSLGWALGATVGAHLGSEVAKKNYELLVAIVGDGTFLFGVPSTSYWMARKYNTVSGPSAKQYGMWH